jgi:hypothetical protein
LQHSGDILCHDSHEIITFYSVTTMANKLLKLKGTDLIHGDSKLAGNEVAPSISVSTSKLGKIYS